MVDDAGRPDEEVQEENPLVAHRISGRPTTRPLRFDGFDSAARPAARRMRVVASVVYAHGMRVGPVRRLLSGWWQCRKEVHRFVQRALSSELRDAVRRTTARPSAASVPAEKDRA